MLHSKLEVSLGSAIIHGLTLPQDKRHHLEVWGERACAIISLPHSGSKGPLVVRCRLLGFDDKHAVMSWGFLRQVRHLFSPLTC